MNDKPKEQPRSFTAFSSANEEVRRQTETSELARDANARAGQGGANAKPSEITVLERRVLAHERILQALIGHLADDDPEILNQLKARFGNGHNLGEYEQDYVSTEHYGEHFIRSIQAEVDRRKQR